MAEKEPAPEADVLEQTQTIDGSDAPEVEEIPLEVSEADALEQARPLAAADPEPVTLPADVPEADALDQTRTAADTDDEDWR